MKNIILFLILIQFVLSEDKKRRYTEHNFGFSFSINDTDKNLYNLEIDYFIKYLRDLNYIQNYSFNNCTFPMLNYTTSEENNENNRKYITININNSPDIVIATDDLYILGIRTRDHIYYSNIHLTDRIVEMPGYQRYELLYNNTKNNEILPVNTEYDKKFLTEYNDNGILNIRSFLQSVDRITNIDSRIIERPLLFDLNALYIGVSEMIRFRVPALMDEFFDLDGGMNIIRRYKRYFTNWRRYSYELAAEVPENPMTEDEKKLKTKQIVARELLRVMCFVVKTNINPNNSSIFKDRHRNKRDISEYINGVYQMIKVIYSEFPFTVKDLGMENAFRWKEGELYKWHFFNNKCGNKNNKFICDGTIDKYDKIYFYSIDDDNSFYILYQREIPNKCPEKTMYLDKEGNWISNIDLAHPFKVCLSIFFPF